MDNTYQWYQVLEKPFFAPPSWAFGLAWGIIYPLIAIAFIFLIIGVAKKRIPQKLFWLLIINMIGNFIFSPIQFGLQNNVLAMIDILLIITTLAIFEIKIWKYSKVIFWLLIPYLLWGAFATVLQISITFLNL
ncbi:tryptophan-rich sensory protein [Candidatus Nomurabacteria bacterium]|nr:tryptophan-rich sensory protein [Candidatus Nomurabacteria bacterium]